MSPLRCTFSAKVWLERLLVLEVLEDFDDAVAFSDSVSTYMW